MEMCEKHLFVVAPGDEELWCYCLCGSPVKGGYPLKPDKSLDGVFEHWYMTHGIFFDEEL